MNTNSYTGQNYTQQQQQQFCSNFSFCPRYHFIAHTPDTPYPPDSDPPGRSCRITRTILTTVLSKIYRQLLEFMCNKFARPHRILSRTCLWLTDSCAVLCFMSQNICIVNWGDSKKSYSLEGCRRSRIPLPGLCERAKSVFCYTEATETNPYLPRVTILPPTVYISTFPPPGVYSIGSHECWKWQQRNDLCQSEALWKGCHKPEGAVGEWTIGRESAASSHLPHHTTDLQSETSV
jgi:hypothetical protein